MTDIAARPSRIRVSTVILPLFTLLLLGFGWWTGVRTSGVSTFLLPSPGDVAGELTRLPTYLAQQSLHTLFEVAVGFGLAVVAGVLMAIAITASSVVDRMFSPLLVAINAVPKIALGPLLVMWLGFGARPKILVVVLLCFFPVVLSTVAGLRSTPAEIVELARSLDASRLHTFVKVRAPWALPQFFVGLKIAISLAFVGAVVGEFIGGGSEGLGFVINSASATSETPLAFAGIFLLAGLSIVTFYLLVALERAVLPWARETTS